MTTASTVSIQVDAASGVPPYEQVRTQVAEQVADGRIPVGTRLPPVRALAADLGLAAGTVARAYKELEAAGLVSTRGRAGTVVTAAGEACRARLATAADRFARAAHDLGVRREDALGAVTAALDRLA